MSATSSILTWLQSVPNLSKQVSRIGDLADGIVLADVLRSASSAFEGITLNRKAEENKVLRPANLRRLIKALEEQLASHGADLSHIDVVAAKDEDADALTTLAEYVLYYVVQANRTFVEQIVQLPENVQMDLMAAIQRTEGRFGNNAASPASPSPQTSSTDGSDGQRATNATPMSAAGDRNSLGVRSVDVVAARTVHGAQSELAFEIRDEFRQLEQIKSQFAALQKDHTDLSARFLESETDRQHLSAENAQLKTKMSQQLDQLTRLSTADANSTAGANTASAVAAANAASAAQIEKLKADVAARDAEISSLAKRVSELSQIEAERRVLQDRIDTLEATAQKAERLQAQVTKYEKRLEEAKDASERVRQLETEVALQTRRADEAEKQSGELTVLRQVVENVRRQAADAVKDKAEAEAAKERLKREIDALTDDNERLRVQLQAQQSMARASSVTMDTTADSDDEEEASGRVSGLAASKKIAELERELREWKDRANQAQDRAQAEANANAQLQAQLQAQIQAPAQVVQVSLPNPADQAKISALEKENADLRDNRVAMQLQLEELNVENARLNKQQRDQQASQLASQQHQQTREEDRVRIATLEQEKLALTKELQLLRRAAGDYEERMRKMGQTRAENEQLLVNFAERYSAEFLRMRNTVSANMSSPAGKAWLNKMRQENLRQAPGK